MGSAYTDSESETTKDLKLAFPRDAYPKKRKFEVDVVDRFWNPTHKLANLNEMYVINISDQRQLICYSL